jgi:hypothetical protein
LAVRSGYALLFPVAAASVFALRMTGQTWEHDLGTSFGFAMAIIAPVMTVGVMPGTMLARTVSSWLRATRPH